MFFSCLSFSSNHSALRHETPPTLVSNSSYLPTSQMLNVSSMSLGNVLDEEDNFCLQPQLPQSFWPQRLGAWYCYILESPNFLRCVANDLNHSRLLIFKLSSYFTKHWLGNFHFSKCVDCKCWIHLLPLSSSMYKVYTNLSKLHSWLLKW